MKWTDILSRDTNLGKLNVNLIIIGSESSIMGETFGIMALQNQVNLTNDLMNQADWMNDFGMLILYWLNNFWFDHQSNLYL